MRIRDRSRAMPRLIGPAVSVAALAAALGGCVVATPAPVAYVQPPAVVAPAPVVVAPAPVLVYPTPVYVHPRRGRW
jgi:hypothetical protein